ncbi:Serine protease easter-like protein [Tribolium castaneum]|uniref:CLIP domain-containing serine protease n=2 Tax=Tribolium castaneum TaxID=7070 RepID=A0A139WF60_TRICA|nr:PREDICTED: venom protease [Tribolium castaneum]KYB26593.1 Serine protease easter-like protein [Tribolium castaneum]|eukprot:XP_015837028.1 PREDICTED: venom protease [Tribolium castaneum]
MVCSNKLLNVCLFLLLHITIAKRKWAIEDDKCITKSGEIGTCISLNSCKPLFDSINTSISSIQKISSLFRLHHCGFNDKEPKVCCAYNKTDLLPKECGYLDTSGRIVNGRDALLFEFPWMALLIYKNINSGSISEGTSFKCGGTIINDRYILTAAHCLRGLTKTKLIKVRVGEYNIETLEDCEESEDGRICSPPYQDLRVEEVIFHEDYNVLLFQNDIGLIRVPKMNLSLENIRPVCLPLDDNARNYNFTNRYGVVTGWGVTDEATGSTSSTLKKVQIPVVPHEECVKMYQNITKITHQQLCAGSTTNRINGDACAGDSGGPLHVLVKFDGDTRVVQQGIVSFGSRRCGKDKYPGVYTKVAPYIDWILDNINP